MKKPILAAALLGSVGYFYANTNIELAVVLAVIGYVIGLLEAKCAQLEKRIETHENEK